MATENSIYFKLLRKFDSCCRKHPERRLMSEKEINLEAAKQLKIVMESFQKPLSFLRSFGNHPLFFTSVRHENSDVFYPRFEYRPRSWLTIAGFIDQILYMIIFGYLAYRLFHGDYKASSIPGSGRKAIHSSTLADSLMKVFMSTFFLACCGSAMNSFWMNSKFSHWLNNWEKFVFQYAKTFNDSLDLHKLKRFSKQGYIASVLLAAAFSGLALYCYHPCFFDVHSTCSWIDREQSIAFVSFGTCTVLNTTFEHFKWFTMLYAMRTALMEINKGIGSSISCMESDEIKFRHFRSLMYLMRGQMKLMTEIGEVSQLLNVFFLFVIAIINMMFFMQFNAGDLEPVVLAVLMAIGTAQFTRFFATSTVCESITKEEKRILEKVSDFRPTSMKGQIEAQIFINVIIARPSEFNLNNMIIFKRSLFLAIFSNATTYLIALLQLVDVSGSSSSQSSATTLQPETSFNSTAT